jgi:hypothetical protein
MIQKIISGGQTGVDRAGLDVAIELGLPYGGKVPKGRKSQDGQVPLKYQLIELDSPSYAVRTRANVMDSDGTLIICSKDQFSRSRGTKLTVKFAQQYGKPYWAADPSRDHHKVRVLDWIKEYDIRVLNIAGPREETCPGIHAQTVAFLKSICEIGLASGR